MFDPVDICCLTILRTKMQGNQLFTHSLSVVKQGTEEAFGILESRDSLIHRQLHTTRLF